jgi:outer membrane lipoprotein-sorting protein
MFSGDDHMKMVRAAAIGLLLLSVTAAGAQSEAQKGLEKLKSLAGTWHGTTAKGEPVEDTFSLTAGGTAVMGEDKMGPEEMLSLFYVDGDRLLMTHFCPSGNQPRMQATISPDFKTILFDFLDATNLSKPQAGHMHHATYIFSDADHYSQEWTWMQDGKSTTFRSEMQRKK